MEPASELGGLTRNLLFLSGFTAVMAFLVWLLIKLIGPGDSANTKDKEKQSNGATHGAKHGGKGSLGDIKGAVQSRKKKGKPQRERTSSKQEHTLDSPWLQTSLKGHSTEVLAMAVSPNYKYLASVGNDRVVFLWRTKNFSSSDHTQFRVNLGFDSATTICFSPDSTAFLVGKTDQSVEVYKIGKKTGTTEGSSRVQLALKVKTDHVSPIVGIGIHPKFMMSCEEVGRVSLWSLKGISIDSRFVIGTGKCNSAKLSPCTGYLAACGKFNDNVNLFVYAVATDSDSSQGKFRSGKKPLWINKGGEVFGFDWSHDSSKIVAIGSQPKGDLVWKLIQDIQGLRPGETCSGTVPQPETSPDTPKLPVVRLSADGFLLLVGVGEDVHCFSILMGGIPVGVIGDVTFDSHISHIVFGEGDKYFVTSGDKTIRIFTNVPGKREMLRQMEKQVGEKSTGTAMKTRLKAEIVALEEELRHYNDSK